MSIIKDPHLFNEQSLFVDLEGVLGRRLYLKIEGFNFAGSIKLKPAREMVERAEREGLIGPGSTLVESSSGNLGVALSMIAASKGYRFVCVVDPRCNPTTRQLLESLGAQVDLVTEPHPVDGFLGARLNHVRELCASDERYVWLNQYVNPGNWGAHYRWTAPEIAAEFPDLDVLFVGDLEDGRRIGADARLDERAFERRYGGERQAPGAPRRDAVLLPVFLTTLIALVDLFPKTSIFALVPYAALLVLALLLHNLIFTLRHRAEVGLVPVVRDVLVRALGDEGDAGGAGAGGVGRGRDAGAAADGALFTREAALTGPSMLVSSDAADLLGLAPGVRRRTPGLRREEVAQLCDISTTWYTWIEQGRDVTVSPTVCARLATVLKLARAERHYLFELADCADPEHWQGDIQPLPQGLSACVDSVSAPAYILDRSWNVLARNEALLGLFDGWPDRSEQPNLLRYIFLDPAARELVVDWDQRASRAWTRSTRSSGSNGLVM
mgnify:CR=1 FL=1